MHNDHLTLSAVILYNYTVTIMHYALYYQKTNLQIIFEVFE